MRKTPSEPKESTEVRAIMEATAGALRGEKQSDFMLSFPLVRLAADVQRALAYERDEYEQYRADHPHVSDEAMWVCDRCWVCAPWDQPADKIHTGCGGTIRRASRGGVSEEGQDALRDRTRSVVEARSAGLRAEPPPSSGGDQTPYAVLRREE